MIAKNKKIDIIGVCSDKGASMAGTDKGPDAIRLAGLTDSIKALGYEVCDCGNIYAEKNIANGVETTEAATNTKLKNLAEVTDVCKRLYLKTLKTLSSGDFPLMLGGDHSVTAGSAYAALKHYGNIGIIWADAHGDFNNDESSPSGNIHGMPLSALCGLGPNQILPFCCGGDESSCLCDKNGEALGAEKNLFINPKNAVLIGARDLDETEKIRLKDSGVTVITTEEIDKIGMYAAAAKAIQIAGNNTNGIYFSFDLDCVDPLVCSGVGTPSVGGITFREARLLCEQIFKSGRLVAADMVELNALLDNQNQTASVAAQLICFMLGKTLY